MKILSEKSASKSQQRLMGMVHQCQKSGKCASKEVEKVAASIKSGDATDFAETKHKNLPNKVKSESMTFREFMIHENDDAEFDMFMQNVDKILTYTVGFGHQDLEDWNWYSAYEDQYTPQDAVDAFMEETGMDNY